MNLKSKKLSFSSNFQGNEESESKFTTKMNCISRRDANGKNIFRQKTYQKGRWNLYSQIAIKNQTLVCANESYDLKEICNDNCDRSQPCTLLDTKEVVEINHGLWG